MPLAAPDNNVDVAKPADTHDPPSAADLVAAVDYADQLLLLYAITSGCPAKPSVELVAAAVEHAAAVFAKRRAVADNIDAAPPWAVQLQKELDALKTAVHALGAKLDARFDALDAKLDTKLETLGTHLDTGLDAPSCDPSQLADSLSALSVHLAATSR